MPPPPPPSKSYLLVIHDTDSEDDRDDDFRIQPSPPPPPPPANNNPSTIPSALQEPKPQQATVAQNSGHRRPHVVEDDDDDDDDSSPSEENEEEKEERIPNEASLTGAASKAKKTKTTSSKLSKNQKKRQAKKRKKKKSKRDQEGDANEKPRVSFSTVEIRLYPRCFSGVSVPLDGGWPLGLELDHVETIEGIPLEDYETRKQEDLRERWEKILDSKKADEAVEKNMTHRPKGIPLLLETRQWDYRSGIKNPLFGLLTEEQRQALFLESSNSKSASSMENYPPAPSSPKRRSRSNSVSSSVEQFNETYNQVYVHHVRNELEELRNERSKSCATGCNCRKMTVYLPPKDGSGGKRAQHRRLKPSKLTSELKKRGLYDPSASREDLEHTLHDAVAAEPCCRDDDCFCARNGIDCQADACSCWHDSHVHSKSETQYLSVQEIQNRCGNPFGTTTVDNTGIDKFRKHVLETSICQPVGTMI